MKHIYFILNNDVPGRAAAFQSKLSSSNRRPESSQILSKRASPKIIGAGLQRLGYGYIRHLRGAHRPIATQPDRHHRAGTLFRDNGVISRRDSHRPRVADRHGKLSKARRRADGDGRRTDISNAIVSTAGRKPDGCSAAEPRNETMRCKQAARMHTHWGVTTGSLHVSAATSLKG